MNAEVDERTIHEIYLPAFKAGVDAGAREPTTYLTRDVPAYLEDGRIPVSNIDAMVKHTLTAQLMMGFDKPSGHYTVDGGGTGAYPAIVCRETQVEDFTIYRPENMQAAVEKEGKPLPVVLFANGGCSYTSKGFKRYLTEIASHGYYWLDWQLKGMEARQRFFADKEYQQTMFPEWEIIRKNW